MHKRCGCVLGMFPWKVYWRLIQKDLYSLNSVWWILGMQNLCHKELVLHATNQLFVVDGGADGALVNIVEQNGMNGRLQKEFLGFSGHSALHTV